MAEAASNRWSGSRPNGWEVLKRNRVAMISLAFLIVLVLAAVVLPFFLNDGIKQPTTDQFFRPGTTSADGTRYHMLGTDVNGNDLFYRLLTGAQVSLGVGLVAACLSLFIGTIYGMVSGYAGGRVDGVMMRGIDILLDHPNADPGRQPGQQPGTRTSGEGEIRTPERDKSLCRFSKPVRSTTLAPLQR